MVFSPDGTWFVFGSCDHTIRVWSPALFTLEGHTSGVRGVAFSLNGSHLASASDAKTVRIWTMATQQTCHTTDPPYACNLILINDLSLLLRVYAQ